MDTDLLRAAAAMALDYVGSVDDRAVMPTADAVAALAAFDEPLPETGARADATLRLLARGGRSRDGGLDGRPILRVRHRRHVPGRPRRLVAGRRMGPERRAARSCRRWRPGCTTWCGRGWWTCSRLPADTGRGVRHRGDGRQRDAASPPPGTRCWPRLGWDAQADGLFGAPPVPVVIGERAHSTLSKSLGLVGLGRDRVHVVPADDQGRLRADLLPDLPGPVLVCAQAGEVNTGAFDPFDAIADWMAERGGWLHVDGAFGLWALADPERADLVGGLERADSWATDGHKWLNVTYDCGLAFVRHVEDLRRTFTAAAGYLPGTDRFESMHHTPQSSQRARQVEVWAVLRTLGRRGVAELVARSCRAARTIADRLAAGGLSVLNDVVLNQVLVRLDDGPTTDALIAAVQADGRIWCGPTVWAGASAMRISVSSWKTGAAESALAADVILECAGRVRTPRPR